ncbi:MAG TPA: Gfo/Idh/MocA family oxidoreductase [Alphaproteobacteria bacterium]|nr:Gfo/Idh/MocA family oxidoreductase [Alphaproteobacteria bacterium]
MVRTRIAVIGAGAFGRKHVEVIRANPSCEVAAVADPAPGAAEFARAQNIAYFPDYERLLDEAKPAGVIVAAPNALHLPVGLACAARRVPMLMEKPVADGVEAAQRLVEAARRTQTPLLVGHHRRHNPLLAAAREVVHSGRLGRLTAVSAMWLLQKPHAYFEAGPWRREHGGGPLLINLIHDIDVLRFVAGEVEAVQAFTANAVRGFPVEDTAVVSLRLAGGALASALISDAVAAPWSWELTTAENPMFPTVAENCYVFAGTSGSLTLPKLELWRYGAETGWTAPLQREQIPVTRADPYVRQLQHFCRVIAGEEQPLVSGEDAARTLAVTLAVQRAAELGELVAI